MGQVRDVGKIVHARHGLASGAEPRPPHYCYRVALLVRRLPARITGAYVRHDQDSGSYMISRTSWAQRQAEASFAAHISASSRDGTSMIEKPPMTALVSG